jgi:hypothetical protein
MEQRRMRSLIEREAPDFALDIMERANKVKSEQKEMYQMLLTSKEKAIIEMLRASEGLDVEESEDEEDETLED